MALSSHSRPEAMQAVRLHGPHDLRVDQVPTPTPPGPSEALIRVATTGKGESIPLVHI